MLSTDQSEQKKLINFKMPPTQSKTRQGDFPFAQYLVPEGEKPETKLKQPTDRIPAQRGAPSQRATSGEARLQDLCPEDKSKIGKLVQNLADLKKEKAAIESKLGGYDDEQQKLIESLRSENQTMMRQKQRADQEKKHLESQMSEL